MPLNVYILWFTILDLQQKKISYILLNFAIILLTFVSYCYVFTVSLNEAFYELQNKMFKLKMYKEELLNALGEFLGEHFPLPEKDKSAKKKVWFSQYLLNLECSILFIRCNIFLKSLAQDLQLHFEINIVPTADALGSIGIFQVLCFSIWVFKYLSMFAAGYFLS